MAATGAGSPGRLVQYVVVRSDLVRVLSWPLGAVITQACHAATAAVHLHYAEPDTQRYLADLDNMHKVVLAVSAARQTPFKYHSLLALRGLGNIRTAVMWFIRVYLIRNFKLFWFVVLFGIITFL